MKTKKSYEELSKEGEARWEKLKAFAKAQPDYEAIAAEVNAGIDAAFAMEQARKEVVRSEGGENGEWGGKGRNRKDLWGFGGEGGNENGKAGNGAFIKDLRMRKKVLYMS